MSDTKAQKPKKIIIVKKNVTKEGGHGSSWKVAYADFVTAMMAFFLVLWILGLEPDVKDAVQGYFNDPIGFSETRSSGAGLLAPIGAGKSRAGNAGISSGGGVLWQVDEQLAILVRDHQRSALEEAAVEIRRKLLATPELKGLEDQIEVIVNDQGLRIELVEGRDGETFFALGSASPKPAAQRALTVIGRELAGLGNRVVLEGHTDAYAFIGSGYTNWELSTDRANAARRLMAATGIEPDRFVEIRGYADRELRVPDDPYDPANRRVTILLPYTEVGPSHRGFAIEPIHTMGG